MSEVKEEFKYTEEHEWAVADGELIKIGITDHAQESLGEIVFIELPEIGTILDKSSTFGVIESTKSVSDLYAPVAGEVAEINHSVENEPDIINKSPYDKGWIIKIRVKNIKYLNSLLTSEEYKKLIDG